MISHADLASGMVDLIADRMDHILDRQMIDQMQRVPPPVCVKAPSHRSRCMRFGLLRLLAPS